MNIICSRVDGALARLAIEGQDLTRNESVARHVARCGRCRAAWDDYCLTVSRLPGSLEVPAPNDRFAQAVWARIEAGDRPGEVQRRFGALRPAMALAGVACAAALAWIAMRPEAASVKPTGAPVVATSGPREDTRRVASNNETRALPKQVEAARLRPEPTRRAAPRRRIAAKVRETAPKVRVIIRPVRRLASKPPSAASVTAPQTSGAQSKATTWLDVARYYEQQSDAWSAALAYRRASEQANDPSLHYAAGQASERAGDVAGAIEDYARYLEASSPPQVERNGQTDRRMGDPLRPDRRPV